MKNRRKGIMSFTALLISTVSILFIWGSCNSSSKNKTESSKFRIIHNNDGSDALFNMWFKKRPLSKADINAYVDMVANTNTATTFMMCSGSDFVYYRSKYERMFGDNLNGTLDCPGNPSSKYHLTLAYENNLRLEAEGTDVIKASLERAKERGMEAFITFRVNDLHFADPNDNCRLSYPDFWYNNPQYWLNDSTQGWHSKYALDFSIKEVRDHKLDLITEQLGKYDMIDGFDLDFMRFIVLFKAGEGASKTNLVTDFVKTVKHRVDSVSAIRGKKILLSVRIPITVEGALEKGIDIKEWARLGLIDFVSISAHWCGETATPIAKFKKDFGYDNIPVYGTIDDGGYWPREFFSEGMYRGMVSHILGQGGDGINFFNFYFGDYGDRDNKIELNESGQVCRIRSPRLLAEFASLDSLKTKNKIYCVSDGVTDAYRVLQVTDLPMGCGTGKKAKTTIFIGDNVAETKPQEAILFIRADRPTHLNLEVNGIKINDLKPDYPHIYDRDRGLRDKDTVYAYSLPAGCLKQGDNEVAIIAVDNVAPFYNFFLVKRIEVALKYGDVSTHGYF